MNDIDRILKRVEKNGYACTKSDRKINSKLAKDEELVVFGNRRLKKSIVLKKDKIDFF